MINPHLDNGFYRCALGLISDWKHSRRSGSYLVGQGWALTRPAFFGKMPAPLRWFVPLLARRGMRQQLHGHGMGRHSAAAIASIGQRDITAVAEFLGDKPYFMGDAPCSLDACVYAFMANILWAPLDHPLQRHARQYPQLQAYCERMKARYWAG